MRQKLFHVDPQQTPSFDRGRRESTFHTKFNLPVRTTRSRHCPRHLKLKAVKHVEQLCQFLSGNNVRCGIHTLLVSSRRNAVSCLAASCPIKQHHGRYSQRAATVMITRCGGALQPRKCQWREIQSVQFDSGTVPHQLENNSQTILRATQRVPSKKQGKPQTQHAQTAQELGDVNC